MVGRRVFTLAGTRERSVLLLHRERQYVVARAGRILGALLGPELEPGMLSGDGRSLMRIYSLGFTVVFLLLAALYGHAWSRRERLGLDGLGRHDARTGWIRHLATAGVGVVSLGLAFALPERLTGLAGWVFGALGPVHGFLGARFGRRRAELERRAA